VITVFADRHWKLEKNLDECDAVVVVVEYFEQRIVIMPLSESWSRDWDDTPPPVKSSPPELPVQTSHRSPTIIRNPI